MTDSADQQSSGIDSGIPATVALIVPDTNTTMEREVRALWSGITRLRRVGVPRPMRPIVASDLPDYQANTLKAVAPLVTERPDVVMYGCTTAGFLGGVEGDRAMQRALSALLGVPVVTTASSMVEALHRAGASRPTIVTPYLEASNRGLLDFLVALGIQASSLHSLMFTTTEHYDRAHVDQVRAIAREAAAADAAADSLFIACTQLPTLGLLEELRHALGRPTFSAVQATVEAAQRAVVAARTGDRRAG